MTLVRTTGLLAAAVSLSAAAPVPAQQFDRAAWQADFERVKAGLAQGYANLDWQVERRSFNLVRANEQISAMLDRANSDVEAAIIFYRLVDAFHDPHLQLLPGSPPAAATGLPPQSNVDAEPPMQAGVCGPRYKDGKAATSLPYADAPEWRQVSPAPFQAGLIGDVGVVRIPSFAEDRYLGVCDAVAKSGMDDRARQLATRAELNRQFKALISDLRKRGMNKLVIDVSGNGGGSEWSSELAAMLAEGTLKRPAPRLVGPSCDRTPIWQGKAVCSVYARPAATEEMKGTGAWTGPLAMLTDRRSASAAEEFVTWLKDNGRAKIAGERTYGAGCGYVDGGSAIALKAAPLHIMVPNCSRYTDEGINEVEGISPNVPVDWFALKPERTAAMLNGLFRP